MFVYLQELFEECPWYFEAGECAIFLKLKYCHKHRPKNYLGIRFNTFLLLIALFYRPGPVQYGKIKHRIVTNRDLQINASLLLFITFLVALYFKYSGRLKCNTSQKYRIAPGTDRNTKNMFMYNILTLSLNLGGADNFRLGNVQYL